jgi:hypothetical protein
MAAPTIASRDDPACQPLPGPCASEADPQRDRGDEEEQTPAERRMQASVPPGVEADARHGAEDEEAEDDRQTAPRDEADGEARNGGRQDGEASEKTVGGGPGV